MKSSKFGRVSALVAISLLLAVFSNQVLAQSGSSEWKKRVTIYGWLPDLGGETQFPTGGSGPSLEVDASTLVSKLNFVLMGAVDLRKDTWGMFSDVIYMNLGDTNEKSRDFTLGSTPIPAGVTLSTNFDLKSWVWTFGATYALIDSDSSLTQLIVGARMLDMDQSLDYTFNGNIDSLPVPGRSGTVAAKSTNWDAIVGVKGIARLGSSQKWFLPYYADIGTGDSELTWQAMAGIGYSFGWGDTVLTWRYLDYDMEDGAIQQLDFGGPMLGASFAW